MTISEGAEFAGYRVGSVIGHGGMGVVHEAVHLTLERRVALKLIEPTLAGDQVFRERFKRESKAAASLDHPNVVTIHDAGEEGGQLYLVMEYVDGNDLGELLEGHGSLPTDRAVSCIAPIADALDAAHRLGLIHRDIKPGNILIRREDEGGDGWPLLTDFGLTRQVSSGAGLTDTGRWVGTVDYVSPEQVQGLKADFRADTYSLGCVLFETLAGRVPFPAENDFAKLWAHVNEPAPRLDEVVPKAGSEITEVLLRAMAKDPAERFDSAAEFAAAIRNPTADDRTVGSAKKRQLAPTRGIPAPPVTETRNALPRPDDDAPGKRTGRLPLITASIVAIGIGVGALGWTLLDGTNGKERASRGNLSLAFGEPWQRFSGSEGINGFELAEPIKLNDGGLAGAGLLRAGRVLKPGRRLDPLPASLRARFVTTPGRGLIEIGGDEWWRYRGEVRKGSSRNGITVLMIESSEGYQGLACEGPTDPEQGFEEACASVVPTLALRDATALSPRPESGLADLLGGVQRSLAQAERSARAGLGASGSDRQASAANSLVKAYRAQARRVRGASVPPGAEQSVGRLRQAIEGLATGYRSLAVAARAEDPITYQGASREIAEAAADYTEALRELGASGYRFG